MFVMADSEVQVNRHIANLQNVMCNAFLNIVPFRIYEESNSFIAFNFL